MPDAVDAAVSKAVFDGVRHGFGFQEHASDRLEFRALDQCALLWAEPVLQIEGDVGGHACGALRPRDPHRDRRPEGSAQSSEDAVEFVAPREEDVGEVGRCIGHAVERNTVRERRHERGVWTHVQVRACRDEQVDSHPRCDTQLTPQRRAGVSVRSWDVAHGRPAPSIRACPPECTCRCGEVGVRARRPCRASGRLHDRTRHVGAHRTRTLGEPRASQGVPSGPAHRHHGLRRAPRGRRCRSLLPLRPG